MKTAELKTKSQRELERILKENRDKLRQLRFDLTSGKVKNVREIRALRKDTARILTILTQNKSQTRNKAKSPALVKK